MDKLLQNRQHERIVRAAGQEYPISLENVHMEALENAEEQSKEPDETRTAGMGGMAQCVHTRLR